MILDLKGSSGVIAREPKHTMLKITFLSGQWNERKVSLKVIDWTTLKPVTIYTKTIYVPVSGVYLVEIPLASNSYSNNMKVDLYEVQVTPDIYGMRINVFEQ